MKLKSGAAQELFVVPEVRQVRRKARSGGVAVGESDNGRERKSVAGTREEDGKTVDKVTVGFGNRLDPVIDPGGQGGERDAESGG